MQDRRAVDSEAFAGRVWKAAVSLRWFAKLCAEERWRNRLRACCKQCQAFSARHVDRISIHRS